MLLLYGRCERIVALNHKEITCQNELATHAGKTNLWRVARAARMVISHARTAFAIMNTASFAGIRLDDEPLR